MLTHRASVIAALLGAWLLLTPAVSGNTIIVLVPQSSFCDYQLKCLSNMISDSYITNYCNTIDIIKSMRHAIGDISNVLQCDSGINSLPVA